MKYLIDTQAIIWFAENNAQLSSTARAILESDADECYISMGSLWEIAIKMSLGKLNINGLTLEEFIDEVEEYDFLFLPVERQHLQVVATLPMVHRDPFDRLLVAQALADGMEIVSADGMMDGYEVKRIW